MTSVQRRPLVSALLCACCLGFSYPHCAFGQDADAIVSFGAWSVFKDSVTCWAASSAEEVNTGPEADDDGSVMVYVSFFRKQPVPEISFALDDCCGDKVIADVGGVRADFVYDEDGIYFPAENERDLLFAFLASRQLSVYRPRSSQPVVTFSLMGFKGAYNHLANICEFKHADFTDGDVT